MAHIMEQACLLGQLNTPLFINMGVSPVLVGIYRFWRGINKQGHPNLH